MDVSTAHPLMRHRTAAALILAASLLVGGCSTAAGPAPAQDPGFDGVVEIPDLTEPYTDGHDDGTGHNPADPDRYDGNEYSIPCTDGSLRCTLENSG